MNLGAIVPGTFVVIRRSFSLDEWRSFAAISGDYNRLHHDADYSVDQGFRDAVVPLGLLTTPLSELVGMHLPGDPAFLLRQDCRVLSPVYYGEALTYSCKVIAKSEESRTLTLRVIAVADTRVKLEAEMLVKVRRAEWESDVPFKRPGARALVTGASGAIGAAVARALAAAGWQVHLSGRDSARLQRTRELCARLGCHSESCEADLEDPDGRQRFEAWLKSLGEVDAIVHCASAQVRSGLPALSATNYEGMNLMLRSCVPQMLERQDGCIVALGAAMMRGSSSDWDEYSTAKAMVLNLLERAASRYSSYGLRFIMVSPSQVDTSFTSDVADDLSTTGTLLQPEEVADAILSIINERHIGAGHFALTPEGLHQILATASGRSGRPSLASHERSFPSSNLDGDTLPGVRSRTERDLETFVREMLRLPPSYSLEGAGLGVTPGWDSLRHLELMLALEQSLGRQLRAGEIEDVVTFEGLCRLLSGGSYIRDKTAS